LKSKNKRNGNNNDGLSDGEGDDEVEDDSEEDPDIALFNQGHPQIVKTESTDLKHQNSSTSSIAPPLHHPHPTAGH
jgi:hypothetical protein